MLSLYNDIRFFNHVQIQMDYITSFHNQDICPLPVDHFHIFLFQKIGTHILFLCITCFSPPIRCTQPRKAESKLDKYLLLKNLLYFQEKLRFRTNSHLLKVCHLCMRTTLI